MFSIYLIIIYLILLAIKPTRKIAIALIPWLLFACSYDIMRLLPNFKVNPIDIKGIYQTEKELFGIFTNEGVLIPGEYFKIHHSPFADFLAGCFYLCWVPVPLAFGIWLYLKRNYQIFIKFSIAFLFVNLLGFCGYYIHPAAPPWYAMTYGFNVIYNIPGNVAGLGRFDQLIGIPIFKAIYGKNANVFAAVPSLHASYMLVTTYYAIKSKQNKKVILTFAFICIGIWWTAIYTGHHYIIDVILGIATAIVGILILEKWLFQITKVKTFLLKFREAISKD